MMKMDECRKGGIFGAFFMGVFLVSTFYMAGSFYSGKWSTSIILLFILVLPPLYLTMRSAKKCPSLKKMIVLVFFIVIIPFLLALATSSDYESYRRNWPLIELLFQIPFIIVLFFMQESALRS